MDIFQPMLVERFMDSGILMNEWKLNLKILRKNLTEGMPNPRLQVLFFLEKTSLSEILKIISLE